MDHTVGLRQDSGVLKQSQGNPDPHARQYAPPCIWMNVTGEHEGGYNGTIRPLVPLLL